MTAAREQLARLVVHARNEGAAELSQQLGTSSIIDETDKSRIEAMNRLVSALKGNARVRYEIDTAELITT